MPAPGVFNQVHGTLAAVEAVYGTAETLVAATDGCLPYLADGDLPAPTPVAYVYDGSQGRAPATLAPQRRTTPNGRFRDFTFRCLPRGAGAAYSASVKPPNELHRWLLASGYDATFSNTPTPQWTYAPSGPGQGSSLTVGGYDQGALWAMTGVICDMSWASDGLGVPIMEFASKGIAALPTTAALPAITYPFGAILPPVASAVVANIGDLASLFVLRKSSFKKQRKIDTPRINQLLAGGHAGFVPGAFVPMFEFEIEQTVRVVTPFHTADGLDAEALMAAATSVPLSVKFGTTQYNRWTHSTAQAQLVSVQPGNVGGLAIWTLGFACHPSTPSLNDTDAILLN